MHVELPDSDNSAFYVATVIVLFLNIAIVLYIWYLLGPNITPVNDAWVGLYKTDHPDWFPLDQGYERYVWNIPYFLNQFVEIQGFNLLNLQLALVNISLGLGIFLLIDFAIPKRYMFSGLSSLLITYFPFDGTLFWLGAFGISMGYAFCILSLFLLALSIKRSSNFLFLSSLVFLILSLFTYSGYFVFQFVIFILLAYILYKRHPSSSLKVKVFTYIGIWSLGLAYLVYTIFSHKSREARILDLDFLEVFRSFVFAFKQLYITQFSESLMLFAGNISITVMFTLVALSIPLFFLGQISNATLPELRASFRSMTVVLVLLTPILLISGYLPFSVSEIRYGTERQLMFARSGPVLMYVALVIWLSYSLSRNKTRAEAVIATIGAISLLAAIQSKAPKIQEIRADSEYERIFLGTVIEALPRLDNQKVTLFKFSDKDAPGMLVNRPGYLLGYAYDIPLGNIYGSNPFQFEKLMSSYKNGEFTIRGRTVASANLVVFEYELENGLHLVDSHPSSSPPRESTPLRLPSSPRSAEPLTPKQTWFVKEMKRLRQE